MKALPLTKVEEVIRQLEPHMDQARQLDDFTLQRYKREVTKNFHAYPWAGYVALGMIAVLEWDEQGVEENYKKALGLRNDADTHFQFATSLQLIGLYERASDEALIASDLEPENLSYLRFAIVYAQHAGRIALALNLVDRFDQRSPRSEYEDRESISHIQSVLETTGISEDVVAQCNRLAFEILRKNRTPYVSTRMHTDIQDNFVMCYIEIDVPQDEVERLDEELGITLFDNIPDFHPDKYWVGYAKSGAAK